MVSDHRLDWRMSKFLFVPVVFILSLATVCAAEKGIPRGLPSTAGWVGLAPPPECRTGPTDREGRRKDCSTASVCIQSGAGMQFVQSSAELTKVVDGEQPRCRMSFENYTTIKRYAGIFEPSRVCVSGSIKSKGGVLNEGHRGRITCNLRIFQRS